MARKCRRSIDSVVREITVGNALCIDEAAIVSNMNTLQRRRSFCVEMEVGTGKTYSLHQDNL